MQNPKEGCEEHIERSESVRSGEEDLPGSRYPQVSLSQGSVEQAFLNFLERDGDKVRVERNLTPMKLRVEEALVDDFDAHPVEVLLRELGKDERASSPDSTGMCYPENLVPFLIKSQYLRRVPRKLFEQSMSWELMVHIAGHEKL